MPNQTIHIEFNIRIRKTKMFLKILFIVISKIVFANCDLALARQYACLYFNNIFLLNNNSNTNIHFSVFYCSGYMLSKLLVG